MVQLLCINDHLAPLDLGVLLAFCQEGGSNDNL
jgi:hypothetical protein